VLGNDKQLVYSDELTDYLTLSRANTEDVMSYGRVGIYCHTHGYIMPEVGR